MMRDVERLVFDKESVDDISAGLNATRFEVGVEQIAQGDFEIGIINRSGAVIDSLFDQAGTDLNHGDTHAMLVSVNAGLKEMVGTQKLLKELRDQGLIQD